MLTLLCTDHAILYSLFLPIANTNTTNHCMKDTEEKEWLVQRYEETRTRPLSEVNQRSLLRHMLRSQTLDNFLGKKFGTLKRYGAEGAEAMMAFFQEMLSAASSG